MRYRHERRGWTGPAVVRLEEIVAILCAVHASGRARVLRQAGPIGRDVVDLPVRELRGDIVADDDETARLGRRVPPGKLRRLVAARYAVCGARVLPGRVRDRVDHAQRQRPTVDEGGTVQAHVVMVLIRS